MKKLLFITLSLVTFSQVYAQSISIDSISINGSWKWTVNFKNILDTGIKIDSIVSSKLADSFFYERMLYIGKSSFIYLPKENVCEASSIWFDKIKKVNIGNCLIDSSTTLNDLKTCFPKDCETIKEARIYGQDGTYQYIRIPVKGKQGQLLGLQIIIFLKDNKVAKVDFWEPM